MYIDSKKSSNYLLQRTLNLHGASWNWLLLPLSQYLLLSVKCSSTQYLSIIIAIMIINTIYIIIIIITIVITFIL